MSGGERDGGGAGEYAAAAAEEEKVVGVWGWGAGSEGQLGTGSHDDQHSPQPLFFFRSNSHAAASAASTGTGTATTDIDADHGNNNLSASSSSSHAPVVISHIACGGAHAIALMGGGSVMTWGRGTRGQLGHGELRNCLLPKPVKFFERFTISYVSAGWNHSGFITDGGHLFTCGDGSFGQLGHGDYQSHSSPDEVIFFVSKNVGQIACGMRHSLVLVKGPSGDSIYGFGLGRRGQLGITFDGINKSSPVPKAIDKFANDEIFSICANGDHSAALSSNGQLYTWGRGFSGRSDGYVPQILPSPLKFSQVALGWNHALALTDNGEVLMLGGERHGMLSGSQDLEQPAPVPFPPRLNLDETAASAMERVPCLDGRKVVHIAAGAEHSAVVTECGEIMSWGWGEHGQLGLGNTSDQTCPQIVNLGYEDSNLHTGEYRVYCGSGFTVARRTVI